MTPSWPMEYEGSEAVWLPRWGSKAMPSVWFLGDVSSTGSQTPWKKYDYAKTMMPDRPWVHTLVDSPVQLSLNRQHHLPAMWMSLHEWPAQEAFGWHLTLAPKISYLSKLLTQKSWWLLAGNYFVTEYYSSWKYRLKSMFSALSLITSKMERQT